MNKDDFMTKVKQDMKVQFICIKTSIDELYYAHCISEHTMKQMLADVEELENKIL